MVLLQTLACIYLSLSFPLASGKLVRRNYNKDDNVPITVTNISPGGNSENGKFFLYPISYFDETANFCYADKFVKDDDKEGQAKLQKYQSENNVIKYDSIFEDDISYGPRTIESVFQQDITCQQICWRDYRSVNASRINFLIENDYRFNFFIDDIPVGKEFYDFNSNKFYISNNIPIGYKDINHVLHIYNHWQLIVYYTNNGLNSYNIIKAVMQQRAAKRVKQHENQCQIYPPQVLRTKPNVDNKVIFTYDVVWKEISNEMTNHYDWNNRLDQFKHNLVNHKFDNIQNSLYFVLIIFVAIYSSNKFSSILSADTRSYKSLAGDDVTDADIVAIGEDDDLLVNWYSLKNDVFRKPNKLIFFSNIVGLGIQSIVVAVITLLLLITNHITIITPYEVKYTIFTLILLTSAIQAYVSGTIYKNFHPSFLHNTTVTFSSIISEHKSLLIVNAVFTPAVFAVANIFLNSGYAAVKSTKYLTFATLFNLFVFKFALIYVPLSIIGSLYALKVSSNTYTLNNPSLKVNMIEKKIPSSTPLLNRPIISSLVVAAFPFSVISNRLTYLWAGILFNNLYFGFWNYLISLFLAAAISVLANIMMTFNALNVGNWKWQWLTVDSGLAVGLFSFIYGFRSVNWNKFGDAPSFFIFVAENFLVSSLIGAGFASINFYFTWAFVRKLYNSKA